MKTLGLLLLILFSSPLAGLSQCQVLVWSDEFNDTGSPNSAFWGYDLGASGWGNQEIQNYTSSITNARQENGVLIIDAIKSGNNWTSARLKTQNKISFKYGKIVFRAKLPTGVGTWPALWMLGDNITSVGWPACGEIDIMEHVGRNQNVIQAALHNPSSYGNTQNKGSIINNTASTEFHEYAVSWNADRMIFYVDDVPYYTYSPNSKNVSNWPYDANHFIIMNIAIGGTFGGTVDPALTSARMEIDYVRVYEERTEPLIEGASNVFQNQQNLVYTAPDYGNDVVYTWSVPNDATLVNGQGTREIEVNWGESDGQISLSLTGETGCTTNYTSLNISTVIDPTGLKYTLENFINSELPGWTKNDNGIQFQAQNNQLDVTYQISSLKFIQYEFPRAVHTSDYGILKIPIKVPAGSNASKLIITFRDAAGNETIATNFEIDIQKKDGNFYTYSYNFNDLWSLNNPAVNDDAIKSLRIYMLAGNGTYSIGPPALYQSKTLPDPPSELTAEINTSGEIQLRWSNESSATGYNLYYSTTETGEFQKIKSSIGTHEIPFVITPSEAVNY